MTFRRLRRPLHWFPVLVAVALSVSACVSSAAGTAVTAAWTPPPIDSLSASVVSDESILLAVSPDLGKAVREQDGRSACWVGRTEPDLPGVCADLPDSVGRMSAAFSPDGTRYLVFPDSAVSPEDTGAWIVTASTGRVIAIDPVTVAGSASAVPPTGTSGASAGPSAERRSVVMDLKWDGNDRIVGLTLDHVLRIDPATGAADVAATLPAPERPVLPSMAVGGSTVVVLQGSSLVRIDLSTGSSTTLTVRLGEDGSRPILMGVSPDGVRALVSTTDLARFTPGPASIVGLAESSLTEIPGTTDDFVVAGGFSPDGARILLVATAGGNSESDDDDPSAEARLLVAPADATAAAREIGPADVAPLGALVWSRTNVVTSLPPTALGARARPDGRGRWRIVPTTCLGRLAEAWGVIDSIRARITRHRAERAAYRRALRIPEDPYADLALAT